MAKAAFDSFRLFGGEINYIYCSGEPSPKNSNFPLKNLAFSKAAENIIQWFRILIRKQMPYTPKCPAKMLFWETLKTRTNAIWIKAISARIWGIFCSLKELLLIVKNW